MSQIVHWIIDKSAGWAERRHTACGRLGRNSFGKHMRGLVAASTDENRVTCKQCRSMIADVFPVSEAGIAKQLGRQP